MAKQKLCRAVNIKLYNTQANNIKNRKFGLSIISICNIIRHTTSRLGNFITTHLRPCGVFRHCGGFSFWMKKPFAAATFGTAADFPS
jgi:hypothetical protein